MTPALFLDTTVVRNFAAVGRLDLLWDILRDRGRWSAAVAYEVELASHYVEGVDLRSCRTALKHPVEVDDPKLVERVELLRRAVFGGSDEQPLKHLGEAETLVLLEDEPWSGARWLSDDRHAVRYARQRGFLVGETVDLLDAAVSTADLSSREADDLVLSMAEQGRGLRLPARLRS